MHRIWYELLGQTKIDMSFISPTTFPIFQPPDFSAHFLDMARPIQSRRRRFICLIIELWSRIPPSSWPPNLPNFGTGRVSRFPSPEEINLSTFSPCLRTSDSFRSSVNARVWFLHIYKQAWQKCVWHPGEYIFPFQHAIVEKCWPIDLKMATFSYFSPLELWSMSQCIGSTICNNAINTCLSWKWPGTGNGTRKPEAEWERNAQCQPERTPFSRVLYPEDLGNKKGKKCGIFYGEKNECRILISWQTRKKGHFRMTKGRSKVGEPSNSSRHFTRVPNRESGHFRKFRPHRE